LIRIDVAGLTPLKSKIVYKNFANKNPKKETKQIVDFWGFFVYIVIIRLVLFHCRLYIGHCLPNSSLPIEELFLRAVLYRGGNYDCQVQ